LPRDASLCYARQTGGVAQLGERNTGSVEVRGSNPLTSTGKPNQKRDDREQ
jgi:hypothetical protein